MLGQRRRRWTNIRSTYGVSCLTNHNPVAQLLLYLVVFIYVLKLEFLALSPVLNGGDVSIHEKIGQFDKLNICRKKVYKTIIHCLHDFLHKQDSQLNSSVLITVWRFVIEKSVTGLPTK